MCKYRHCFFFHARATKNNNGITQQYEQRLPQYSSDRHPACLLQPEIPHALFLPLPSPLCLVFFFCFLCLEKLCFSHLPFPSYGRWGPRPDPMPGREGRGETRACMQHTYFFFVRRRRAHISLPFLTRPTRRRRRHLISPLPCVPASCDT